MREVYLSAPAKTAVAQRESEVDMQLPFVIRRNNTLIIAIKEFFGTVAWLDEKSGMIEANVLHDGQAGLIWIIDAAGVFYELTSSEYVAPTILQFLGIKRRRQKYKIAPGRTISAKELIGFIDELSDQQEEISNVSDLRKQIISLPLEHPINRADMVKYLGE